MTQSATTQSVSTGGARQRLPFSVRVVDVLTVLLCAAAVSVVLFGGFRFRVAAVILTVHSAFRLLLLAALLSAIRHYFRRTPSLLSRVRDGLRRLWRSESFRAIAPSFAWSRAAVFMVAYLSVITIGYPTKILFRVSDNEMVNLPARWDAGWYLGIAREGYRYDPLSRHQQNVAFFPMYPMTTSVLGVFLGGHVDEGEARFSSPARMVWAGVLLNLAALAAALGYLYRMVRGFADRAAAVSAVQFALAYPLAFIFNGTYTEGLFLLASVATFYHFGRGQLAAAAGWGTITGLTRPNGFIVSIPLLAIALARSGPVPRLALIMDRLGATESRPRRLVAEVLTSAAPLVGMFLFSAYIYSQWGDPFLWAKLHAAWGRTYHGLNDARESLDAMMEFGIYEYTALARFEVLHVLFFLLTVVLAIPIAWRVGVAYSALMLLTVIPPLLVGGWLSMARVTVVLFPIYVYLAVALPPAHRGPLVLAFAVLQGLGTALFFTWRPFF